MLIRSPMIFIHKTGELIDDWVKDIPGSSIWSRKDGYVLFLPFSKPFLLSLSSVKIFEGRMNVSDQYYVNCMMPKPPPKSRHWVVCVR